MPARPIQLTDAAFLMLRRSLDRPAEGLRLGAADVLAAAELVEAEYAVVHDGDDRIELQVTPAGREYMRMIDGLTRPADAVKPGQ